jgi:hypothetical protein
MRKALFCFVLAIALPALASDLVITDLTIDPSPSLPGEPIWVTLSIKNNGSKPLPLPKYGFLEAVPEAGEPVALRSMDIVVSPLRDYREFKLVVPAGETIRLDFTNGAIADGFLFQEPRLWKPGRHFLRVLLFESLGTDGTLSLLGSVPWPELFATGRLTAPPIVSPDALFAVLEPSGVDAEAWAAFMRHSDGLGFNRGSAEQRAELAYEIATRFPDSAYAPYFAARTGAPYQTKERREANLRLHDEAVARHPNSPASEYLRGRAPFVKAMKAEEEAPDLETAFRMVDEARGDVEQLLKNTRRTLTRLQLQKESKTLPTREAIESAFEFRRRTAAAKRE